MVHRFVTSVVPARERRHYQIWHSEPKLRSEARYRGGITRMRPRIVGTQVAVIGVHARSCRRAREEAICIDCDWADVALNGSKCRTCELVGLTGYRRNMVIRATAFVEAEEEHRITPRWTRH